MTVLCYSGFIQFMCQAIFFLQPRSDIHSVRILRLSKMEHYKSINFWKGGGGVLQGGRKGGRGGGGASSNHESAKFPPKK